MMIIALLAVAAAVQSAPSVPAPSIAPPTSPVQVDPAALTAATKLLAELHLDQTVDHMMNTLIPVMTTAFMGGLEHQGSTQTMMTTIENQSNGRNRMMAIFADEISKSFRTRYPAIVAAAAREYATEFSAAELQQLIGFFGSGVGAKWIMQSPQLQQAIGTAASQIGRDAGMEAGARTMQRAIHEILPPQKSSS